MKDIEAKDYKKFFEEIVEQINQTRIKAIQSVNYSLIQSYFNIGRLIFEKQQQFGWGKSIVEKLSRDLQAIFDGVEGYSPQNLWYMRQFYIEYKDFPGLLKEAVKIPWGQNILIFSKIKDKAAREYYLKTTSQFAWSRSVLLNQIKANAYENHLTVPKQHNFKKVLPAYLAEQADEAIKSSYNLEFLGITKPIHERKMEKLMVEKVKKLIMELGYGFCFIGNQYRLKGNKKDYYIDLLFYHRKLRSLVVFEIKATEYKAEYAGKMNLYLNLLDEQIKMEDENPSIGIILCAEKDNFEVEYSLKNLNKPLGVAEYQLTKQLPGNLKGKLPTPQELKEEIIDKINEEI